MTCPSCRRPVAVARERCLYCGAALPSPAGPVPAAAPQPETRTESPPASPADRALLVVDLESADATVVARALKLSRFDAAQRARRGGPQLWRLAGAPEVSREAGEIAAEGLPVTILPEAEIRLASRPRVALGGRFADGTLDARVEGGRMRIAGPDLLLVVRGPIARTYPTAPEDLKRPRMATLEPGYRVHLHCHADPQPLELDPGSFEFSDPASAGRSSLLELLAWVEALARDAPIDNDFRLLAPALGVSAREASGVGALVATLARPAAGRSAGNAPVVLDNLAQFRFYSAWRGALARRKSSPAG